jgi:hypothetical protein
MHGVLAVRSHPLTADLCIATRYDKTARNFLAAVLLAASRLSIRFESTP